MKWLAHCFHWVFKRTWCRRKCFQGSILQGAEPESCKALTRMLGFTQMNCPIHFSEAAHVFTCLSSLKDQGQSAQHHDRSKLETVAYSRQPNCFGTFAGRRCYERRLKHSTEHSFDKHLRTTTLKTGVLHPNNRNLP